MKNDDFVPDFTMPQNCKEFCDYIHDFTNPENPVAVLIDFMFWSVPNTFNYDKLVDERMSDLEAYESGQLIHQQHNLENSSASSAWDDKCRSESQHQCTDA